MYYFGEHQSPVYVGGLHCPSTMSFSHIHHLADFMEMGLYQSVEVQDLWETRLVCVWKWLSRPPCLALWQINRRLLTTLLLHQCGTHRGSNGTSV